MGIAENAVWSQTAFLYGPPFTCRSTEIKDNLSASLDSTPKNTVISTLKQLVTMNSWLREALDQQKQVSAQLWLLLENTKTSTPLASSAPHGCGLRPIMATANNSAAHSLKYRKNAESRAASLTARQREIMDLVLVGHPSKNIAADLRLSQRTVENHRAAVMKKMGVGTLVDLVRVGVAIEGWKFGNIDCSGAELPLVSASLRNGIQAQTVAADHN